ncbi:F0F1 ATP synthase subunit B [Streptomyces sp. H10-C2]|uniref:F0F1 ATP synthase subunit B n=1 Tax=unclassified Streptomyces TaxID=2593676 RepID=UPI0024B8DDEC|nr:MULTISPECIES: F0F1 ATP synthase subunit B [unclassified Streptomyces]MDJ0347112.1 F0F1 ATP synthase subunit B [Streptomyces sp. PH10-H1]MDJ0375339.1 F0F1 ATP synthase subunit B [Streptomyces sp. H10-C2]
MDILTPKLADLLIGLLGFLVVFGVLAKVLLPRINKVLSDRADAIEGRLERAEDIAAEAARTLAAYQKQIAEARHEAARLRHDAVEQGATLIAEIRAEGLREREATVAAGQQQIAAHRVLAETELRGDVASLATELAGRIVGEAVEDVVLTSAIVDRFFADLDAQATKAPQSAGS